MLNKSWICRVVLPALFKITLFNVIHIQKSFLNKKLTIFTFSLIKLFKVVETTFKN